MNKVTIRTLRKDEISSVAAFVAKGYEDDAFFAWVVGDATCRHAIITAYYQAYLSAVGCVSHVALDDESNIVGATVWLPHDVDETLYDAINEVVGPYKSQFQEVADRSHDNEPKNIPFYQLVGVVVAKHRKNEGIGHHLLKTFLDQLDDEGIGTYLEASTPYSGGGIYGKFGYEYYGDKMVFSDKAILYPLFRPALRKPDKVGHNLLKAAFIWDERYFWHHAGNGALFEPAGEYIQENGSVESPESKRRVKNLVERSGLIDHLLCVKPVFATTEQLRYFHTQAHIDRVEEMSKVGGLDCGDSAIVGKGSFEIAKLSVGGAIAAVDTVMKNESVKQAYVLTRPPGHHAEVDRGMGFCIFNNVAIATFYAKYRYKLNRIAIIDWDAHHGNGTEDAFYEDNQVLFISIHQDNLEPIGRGKIEDRGNGEGEEYTLNIPLPPGSGDAAYQYAFDKLVTPALDAFKPELIFISAGQDASIFDPLARMMLSADGYRQLTKSVQKIAKKYSNDRLICLHEGGYSEAYVPFCTHAIIEELAGIKTKVEDPFIYAMAGTGYNVLSTMQKEWIDNMVLKKEQNNS